VQRHGCEPEAERDAVIDHAGTLLSLTGGWGRVSPDERTQILREAAEHIVALRQQLAVADERAANLSAGYARLIEQAAELVGEAARAVR
jgi:acyl-CoA reductase-like NAD-dependent aldehyde dehydrogenase